MLGKRRSLGYSMILHNNVFLQMEMLVLNGLFSIGFILNHIQIGHSLIHFALLSILCYKNCRMDRKSVEDMASICQLKDLQWRIQRGSGGLA